MWRVLHYNLYIRDSGNELVHYIHVNIAQATREGSKGIACVFFVLRETFSDFSSNSPTEADAQKQQILILALKKARVFKR